MSNNNGKSNESMFSKENIQERGTSSTQYSSQIVGNIPCGRYDDLDTAFDREASADRDGVMESDLGSE